jgi:hypothetical protein
MDVEAVLVGKLFVAEIADPLLLGLEMASHVLVVGIFGHVRIAKPASEHLGILCELILALMSFDVLEGLEAQATELAVTNVIHPKVDFGAFTFLVETGVFGDPGVSRVLLPANLTDVAMRV